jgi:hypothetical protein
LSQKQFGRCYFRDSREQHKGLDVVETDIYKFHRVGKLILGPKTATGPANGSWSSGAMAASFAGKRVYSDGNVSPMNDLNRTRTNVIKRRQFRPDLRAFRAGSANLDSGISGVSA